uniref:Uncharacterized protein n=1 Tax=Oryza brachyantha TaxID=4533 RepID=J3MEI0_ORYBR
MLARFQIIILPTICPWYCCTVPSYSPSPSSVGSTFVLLSGPCAIHHYFASLLCPCALMRHLPHLPRDMLQSPSPLAEIAAAAALHPLATATGSLVLQHTSAASFPSSCIGAAAGDDDGSGVSPRMKTNPSGEHLG